MSLFIYGLFYAPSCLKLFCFQGPCQYVLLNLRPLNFSLTLIDYQRSIILTPNYSIIPYGNVTFNLRLFYAHLVLSLLFYGTCQPGAWVATGHVGGWRIARGPVLVAGLSLNKQETVDQLPNPKVLLVACLNPCWRGEWHLSDVFFNGASRKPDDIPEYVTLHWYRELYQC
jgi:hypothetical protein